MILAFHSSTVTQEKESMCLYKDLYTNVHYNFICNLQRKPAVQIPYDGILLSNEKEQTIPKPCSTAWVDLNFILLNERSPLYLPQKVHTIRLHLYVTLANVNSSVVKERRPLGCLGMKEALQEGKGQL